MDPFRSSLAPRTVEALVCTQNWLKSTLICLSQNYIDAIDDAESYKLDSGNVFRDFFKLLYMLILIFSDINLLYFNILM